MKMLRCLPPTTLGDAAPLDAARRLKAQLPSRSHIVMAEPRTLFGGVRGGSREVEVQGVRYGSIRKAARAHRVTPFTMHKWLEEGRAAYADE